MLSKCASGRDVATLDAHVTKLEATLQLISLPGRKTSVLKEDADVFAMCSFIAFGTPHRARLAGTEVALHLDVDRSTSHSKCVHLLHGDKSYAQAAQRIARQNYLIFRSLAKCAIRLA